VAACRAAYIAQCYPPSVWTEDKTAKIFSVRNPNPKSKPNPSPKFLIP